MPLAREAASYLKLVQGLSSVDESSVVVTDLPPKATLPFPKRAGYISRLRKVVPQHSNARCPGEGDALGLVFSYVPA